MSTNANAHQVTIAAQLRAIGASHITLGQLYHSMAETREKELAEAGYAAAAPAAVAAPVAPPAAAPLAPPPAFPQAAAPAAPAAPIAGAPAAPVGDDGKPKRVRRTKAQIEADEAAIKLGYTSHADMLAKTGGAAPAAMPSAPMAPAGAPVQAVQHVQQPGMPPAPPAAVAPVTPPPPPAAPAFTGPSIEDLIASLQGMIQCVETAGWVGHGEGQAATLLGKLGYQTVHTVPAEQRQVVIDWVNHFKTEFMAGRLPTGAATAGFIS